MKRLESIDLLRGIIMVIMTLDHVRDFVSIHSNSLDTTDLTKTFPLLFITRWITHFCAPVFVFLTGASAFLAGERRPNKLSLSKLLITRGLWLIFIEFTVVLVGLRFAFNFQPLVFQVFWALGISMIVLGFVCSFSKYILLFFGIIIVAGHNMFDSVTTWGNPILDKAWILLHVGLKETEILGIKCIVGYPVLPWIGVTLLGFCFGHLYRANESSEKRRKFLKILGLGLILFFIALRSSNWYGDPAPWLVQPNYINTILSFINLSKYPPSLLFLCMTLGPSIIFLAYAEQKPGKVGKRFIVFGRVPFFYYIVHLYLIHFVAWVLAIATGHSWKSMLFTSDWKSELLKGYGFNLAFTYAIWLVIVLSLYPLCSWYNNYKTSHPNNPWLKYL